MKAAAMILLILVLVVPFSYIIISDLVLLSRRIAEIFGSRVKPALITITNTLFD